MFSQAVAYNTQTISLITFVANKTVLITFTDVLLEAIFIDKFLYNMQT